MGQCMYLHVPMHVKTLFQVRSTRYMGTQPAQNVVVNRSTCTENTWKRVGTSNQWPVQTCTTAV